MPKTPVDENGDSSAYEHDVGAPAESSQWQCPVDAVSQPPAVEFTPQR